MPARVHGVRSTMTNGAGSSVHAGCARAQATACSASTASHTTDRELRASSRQSPARSSGSPRRLPTTRGRVHRRGVPGTSRPPSYEHVFDRSTWTRRRGRGLASVRSRAHLPDVRTSSCVERLARAMAQAHAAGVPFDRAWSSALRGATHGAPYLAALDETREAWKRAYHGEPPTRGEVAVVCSYQPQRSAVRGGGIGKQHGDGVRLELGDEREAASTTRSTKRVNSRRSRSRTSSTLAPSRRCAAMASRSALMLAARASSTCLSASSPSRRSTCSRPLGRRRALGRRARPADPASNAPQAGRTPAFRSPLHPKSRGYPLL